MTELYRHIGTRTRMCPRATSAWVRVRSVICIGQYKRLTGLYEGVLTGKGLTYGGSLARKEATGFGLMLLHARDAQATCNAARTWWAKTVVVSGSWQCGHLCGAEGDGAGREGRSL